MKKILTIFIIITILFVLGGTNIVNAAEATTSDVDITIALPDTIEEGTKTLTATISVGKFVGVTEGQPMGYETILNYDTNMVESVTVSGLNDWTTQFNNNKIIGETSTSKSNVAITKIVITLKDTAIAGAKLRFQFANMNITDAVNLDKTLTITKDVTIIEKKVETSTGNTENTTSVKEEKETENKTVKDETVKNAVLPKAGSYSVIIFIAIIAIAGLLGIIRYHSIKVK